MQYLVSFRPSQEWQTRAQQFIQQTKDHLQPPTHDLHCTLYHFHSDHDEEQITQAAQGLLRGPLQVSTDDVIIQDTHKHTLEHVVVTTLRRPMELLFLHYDVAQRLREYRIKNTQSPEQTYTRLVLEKYQMQGIRDYGSPFFGNVWKPHITLGVCRQPQGPPLDVLEHSGLQDKTWDLTQLYVEKKENGRWQTISTVLLEQ